MPVDVDGHTDAVLQHPTEVGARQVQVDRMREHLVGVRLRGEHIRKDGDSVTFCLKTVKIFAKSNN